MCDCPKDKKHDNVHVPETVTLFKKCTGSYQAEKDVVEPLTCDTISDKDATGLIDSSQSDLRCAFSNSTKKSSSSSNSSTTSTKIYNFVSPRECECLGEAEEELWEPPVLTYEPCVEEEEVEERPDVECTLVIVKPEAVIYRKEIERRIFEEGFEIYQTRWLQLTPEQVSEFYSDKYGQLNFAHLVAYMASGPIVVHVLAKKHAVQEWRLLMGPTRVAEARLYYPDSLRARYGRRGEDFKNAIHGSSSRVEAEREIHFFFPQFIIDPLLKNEAAVDYLWETLNPVLVKALSMVKSTVYNSFNIPSTLTAMLFAAQCCKLKPGDPVLWLANWLIVNNPNKPKLPQDLAMVPI